MNENKDNVPRINHHHHQCVAVLKEHFWDVFEHKITGIEIGTNAGDLTVTLLRDIPEIEILDTIDPWRHFEMAQFEAGNEQDYHDKQMLAATKRLQQFGHRVRINQMTSDEFFHKYPEIKVDFVWIDGHHEYSQVKRDIQNAKQVVKICGIIGGHDYGLVGDVKKAVLEEFQEGRVHTGGDFTWWVYV